MRVFFFLLLSCWSRALQKRMRRRVPRSLSPPHLRILHGRKGSSRSRMPLYLPQGLASQQIGILSDSYLRWRFRNTQTHTLTHTTHRRKWFVPLVLYHGFIASRSVRWFHLWNWLLVRRDNMIFWDGHLFPFRPGGLRRMIDTSLVSP